MVIIIEQQKSNLFSFIGIQCCFIILQWNISLAHSFNELDNFLLKCPPMSHSLNCYICVQLNWSKILVLPLLRNPFSMDRFFSMFPFHSEMTSLSRICELQVHEVQTRAVFAILSVQVQNTTWPHSCNSWMSKMPILRWDFSTAHMWASSVLLLQALIITKGYPYSNMANCVLFDEKYKLR